MVYIPKAQGRVKTYLQVAWALQTPVVLLMDNNYYPTLLEMLHEFQGEMPLMPYVEDKHDCDNYALTYVGIAVSKTNAVGIIVGRYKKTMHVWNMAITVSGVWQIEPQSGYIFRHYKDYRPMIVLL